MQQVRRTVMTLADTSADVLIYGETGTGKELVARCLHDHSERRRTALRAAQLRRPARERWPKASCSATRPAPSPAPTGVRVGKFEYANGGTLFLDEIESMPMAVQIKLLRALQERCIERIGSQQAHPRRLPRGRGEQGRPARR